MSMSDDDMIEVVRCKDCKYYSFAHSNDYNAEGQDRFIPNEERLKGVTE